MAEGGGHRGAAAFARMQAAMWRRLQADARKTFGDVATGAHANWTQATSFQDLVDRIKTSRERLFQWMDDLVCRYSPLPFIVLIVRANREWNEATSSGSVGLLYHQQFATRLTMHQILP